MEKKKEDQWDHIRKISPGDKVINEYLRQQRADGEEQLEPLWEDKILFGTYPCQIEEVISENPTSGCWKAALKDSTESLIMAAPEQALSTDRSRYLQHQAMIHEEMLHISQHLLLFSIMQETEVNILLVLVC